MKSEDLKPYLSKNYATLEKQAVKVFNDYIRARDSQEIPEAFVCISCRELKSITKMHAGHFYSSGHFPILRFDEDNVHGQCHRCNTHLHGNLNEYRQALDHKIGSERLEMLDQKSKAKGHRIDRWTLIEKIIKYKKKLKNQKTYVLEKINHGNCISDPAGNGRSDRKPNQGKLFGRETE